MGLYDEIHGTLKCPECKKKTPVYEQVKWTENPCLNQYKVGDSIDAADGIYDYGSYARETLHNKCSNCGHTIIFSATVKNEILKSLNVVNQ